ncbi:MAG: hypothetical protein WD749_12470 [Phycisphaerales bacterium]
MYTPPGQPFFQPPPQQGPDLSQLLLKNAQIALSTYARMEVDQHLLGKLNVERVRRLPPGAPLREAEFKVHSQFGEDGVIQFLIHHVPIENRSFIEFGVEAYTEANTRFLLVNDNWSGLILDANQGQIESVKRELLARLYDLTALCSFITKENVNALFSGAGFTGDIGLLSVDIDGNDYWVWEAIDAVSPRIVAVEYNSVFGLLPVTIPYQPTFSYRQAHPTGLYCGAGLAALCHLAKRKGYRFVGSTSIGLNAFFVREDVAGSLPSLTAEEGYVESRLRTSTDGTGQPTHLRGRARFEAIRDMPVVNVITGEPMTLAQAEARANVGR